MTAARHWHRRPERTGRGARRDGARPHRRACCHAAETMIQHKSAQNQFKWRGARARRAPRGEAEVHVLGQAVVDAHPHDGALLGGVRASGFPRVFEKSRQSLDQKIPDWDLRAFPRVARRGSGQANNLGQPSPPPDLTLANSLVKMLEQGISRGIPGLFAGIPAGEIAMRSALWFARNSRALGGVGGVDAPPPRRGAEGVDRPLPPRRDRVRVAPRRVHRLVLRVLRGLALLLLRWREPRAPALLSGPQLRAGGVAPAEVADAPLRPGLLPVRGRHVVARAEGRDELEVAVGHRRVDGPAGGGVAVQRRGRAADFVAEPVHERAVRPVGEHAPVGEEELLAGLQPREPLRPRRADALDGRRDEPVGDGGRALRPPPPRPLEADALPGGDRVRGDHPPPGVHVAEAAELDQRLDGDAVGHLREHGGVEPPHVRGEQPSEAAGAAGDAGEAALGAAEGGGRGGGELRPAFRVYLNGASFPLKSLNAALPPHALDAEGVGDRVERLPQLRRTLAPRDLRVEAELVRPDPVVVRLHPRREHPGRCPRFSPTNQLIIRGRLPARAHGELGGAEGVVRELRPGQRRGLRGRGPRAGADAARAGHQPLHPGGRGRPPVERSAAQRPELRRALDALRYPYPAKEVCGLALKGVCGLALKGVCGLALNGACGPALKGVCGLALKGVPGLALKRMCGLALIGDSLPCRPSPLFRAGLHHSSVPAFTTLPCRPSAEGRGSSRSPSNTGAELTCRSGMKLACRSSCPLDRLLPAGVLPPLNVRSTIMMGDGGEQGTGAGSGPVPDRCPGLRTSSHADLRTSSHADLRTSSHADPRTGPVPMQISGPVCMQIPGPDPMQISGPVPMQIPGWVPHADLRLYVGGTARRVLRPPRAVQRRGCRQRPVRIGVYQITQLR
eukprot:gene366-biopygen3872